MKERRKRIMKRLLIEELERREMLTASPETAVLTSNSLEAATMLLPPGQNDSNGAESSAPDIDSGVGQQTITTGANTLGIGSFASPTAGPSKAGGTGNRNLPLIDDLAAADAAIEELFAEPDQQPLAKTDSDAAPADVPQQTTSATTMFGSKQTARRAWNIDPDELNVEEASPAAAGADR